MSAITTTITKVTKVEVESKVITGFLPKPYGVIHITVRFKVDGKDESLLITMCGDGVNEIPLTVKEQVPA